MVAGCLLAAAGGLTVLDAAAASAAAGCSGYTACNIAPYTTHGYDTTTNQYSYWDQYVGDNCTNYVAYLLITVNRLLNEQPWSGTGNAYEWGVAMQSYTNAEPAVGAVACWKADYDGASSLGHVAWVEGVFNDAIVVSEDNYPDDGVTDYSGDQYDWRIITRDGGRWPSGFIHFPTGSATDYTPPPSPSPTPTAPTAPTAPTTPSAPSAPPSAAPTESAGSPSGTPSAAPTTSSSPEPTASETATASSSPTAYSLPPPGPTPAASSAPARIRTRVLGHSVVSRDGHGARAVLVADHLPRDATGVVAFTTESGRRVCVSEVAHGESRCDASTDLRPGRQRLIAHYCGSSTYDGSRDTFVVTIARS